MTIDHDQIFKTLFESFFQEFMQLFFAQIAEQIDFTQVEFLRKEYFTDMHRGKRRAMDLVVKVRLLNGKERFILIHVEFESKRPGRQFAKRMYQRGKLVTDGVDLHDQGEKTLKMLKWARLLNFGFMPNHVWNVANPGKFNIRAWWGRSPAMLGLSRMTAGKWCNPLLWFAVLVGQFIGVFKNPLDSDSRTLPHVVWHYLKTRGLFWQLAYKFWYYVAFTRWKYSLKQVYTNYFGAAHPITKHTKN